MKVNGSAFLSILGFLVLVFIYNRFHDVCSLAKVCGTQLVTQVSDHDHAAAHSGEAVLFELGRLRLSPATHVAVSNGQWSDPRIWSTQEIPGHGARVHIPHGINVIYDLVSENPLKWILVDGSLSWASVQNTQLVVDTIISGPESHILIGSENEPVLAEADIVFKHDPLDSSRDSDLLSRGLIVTGRLSVYGQSKSSFAPALGAARSGDSSLKLSNIPSHWQVGDRIVLTGTRWVQEHWNGFEYEDPETEDEERIIMAIDGRHLTLDRPLSYTHEPADPRFSFHVANLSRSVRFRSALGANTPSGERGHVMLLNPKAAHIFYAGFHHLGRLETGPDTNTTVSGTPPGAGSIPKGRYPLQVLKTVQQTDDPAPVLVHGIAIVESPSQGVVISGAGSVENSVSYNVSGSHFVAHKGFVGGTFRNNMAIRSVGGIHLEGPVEIESLSQGGNGFWIGSRNVVMEGNLVSGARHAGIVYALEPETERGNLSSRFSGESVEVESYEELQLPVHKQLTVYASRLGFAAFHAGSVRLQGMRTAFESLHCWSVGQGIHIERSQSLTFRDLVLIADAGAYHPSHPAMILQHGTRDIIFDKSRIEGFHTAHVSGDIVDGYDDHLEGIFIDTEVTGASQLWVNLDPEKVRFISGAELTPGRLMFSPEQNPGHIHPLPSQLEKFSLRGHIEDSIGTVMFTAQLTREALSGIIAKGYYNCPKEGRCILLSEIIVDRRTHAALQYRYLAKLPDNFSGEVGALRGNAPVDLGIRRLIRSVEASSIARR